MTGDIIRRGAEGVDIRAENRSGRADKPCTHLAVLGPACGVVQLLFDPLAHLGGGGPCEGNDQKLVHPRALAHQPD